MGDMISPQAAAILRNPTVEGAMKLWPHHVRGMESPINDDVVLAGVHKARIAWSGSSKKMVQESKRWLADHGFRAEGP